MQLKPKYCPPPREVDRMFLIDHVRVKPEHQITFHQHLSLEISYIVLGSGTRVIGKTVEPFDAGEIVFIPSDIPHCWSFDNFNTAADGKIENISIFFSPSFLENLYHGFPELRECVDKIRAFENAVVFTGETREKMQRLMKATKEELDVERFCSLVRLLHLVAAAEETSIVGRPQADNRNNDRLQRAYSYVINNFQNPITLNDVAEFIGMEKSSFCTFFKKMTGKSFFSFLSEYRIESSVQMLEKTSLSVAEICHAAGFNDIPYFNRTFKKIKKQTPTNYRNILVA